MIFRIHKTINLSIVTLQKSYRLPQLTQFPEMLVMLASKEFLQGPLRLSNFLVTYRAKQMKQRNTQTGRRKRINMLDLMMIFQFMSRMRLFVTQAAQQHWRTRGPPP